MVTTIPVHAAQILDYTQPARCFPRARCSLADECHRHEWLECLGTASACTVPGFDSLQPRSPRARCQHTESETSRTCIAARPIGQCTAGMLRAGKCDTATSFFASCSCPGVSEGGAFRIEREGGGVTSTRRSNHIINQFHPGKTDFEEVRNCKQRNRTNITTPGRNS